MARPVSTAANTRSAQSQRMSGRTPGTFEAGVGSVAACFERLKSAFELIATTGPHSARGADWCGRWRPLGMARGERASYIAGDMRALPLHSFHAARGSVLKSESEVEFVASAAPRLEGWKAAQEAAVLYDHSGRELITVTGEDRVSFVHGMCTQDINGLAEQAATDATHVTAKGAIVADSRILKLADEVLIDVAPGRGAPLR